MLALLGMTLIGGAIGTGMVFRGQATDRSSLYVSGMAIGVISSVAMILLSFHLAVTLQV